MIPAPDGAWIFASLPVSLVVGRSTLFQIQLPDDVRLAQLGLFTDVDPRLLLATAGYRREDAPVGLLSVFPNPGAGPFSLRMAVGAAEQSVGVWDMRGRLVRTLQVPAFTTLTTWDGRDQEGNAVASGRYILSASDDPARRRVVTLVR